MNRAFPFLLLFLGTTLAFCQFVPTRRKLFSGSSGPLQFIQEAETAWTNNALLTASATTPSFNVLAGDLLVAINMSGDFTGTNTISGGSLTWTLGPRVAAAGFTWVSIWTAVVDSDKSMTVTVSRSATTAVFYGVNVLTWRNATLGASGSITNTTGGPSLDITTTKENSAIVVGNADWTAANGASRVWRTNAGALSEVTYFRDAGQYTVYGGYHANAGAIGTYAVGLTTPNTQKYSIAAVELKGP